LTSSLCAPTNVAQRHPFSKARCVGTGSFHSLAFVVKPAARRSAQILNSQPGDGVRSRYARSRSNVGLQHARQHEFTRFDAQVRPAAPVAPSRRSARHRPRASGELAFRPSARGRLEGLAISWRVTWPGPPESRAGNLEHLELEQDAVAGITAVSLPTLARNTAEGAVGSWMGSNTT
jgi:hypothetical protein